MAFMGYGQLDSGGQALPSLEPVTIVWASANSAISNVDVPTALRPTGTGILYQTGGGGVTPGFGQIFPTGRS